MSKKLDLLFFKLTAGDVTARANGELTPPGTRRLQLYLPLKKGRQRTKAMARFLEAARTILAPLRRSDVCSCLLHTAKLSSPTLSSLFVSLDSIQAHLPPQSRIETEHRRLSEREELFHWNLYHRKRLQDQLVLRLSLSETGLAIDIDAPTHLWLQLYLSGNLPL